VVYDSFQTKVGRRVVSGGRQRTVHTDVNIDAESLMLSQHDKIKYYIIIGSVLTLCSKTEQILFTPVEDIDHQSWRVFGDTV